MSTKTSPPRTLMEAIRYFADPDVAQDFVAALRWPDGPECPACQGKDHSYLTTRRIWKCKACKKQFSVKVGTIFEDSPISLDKWLTSIWLIANAKNGISSHELGKGVGLTQKTAWFVLHRIRLAMQTGTFRRLSGEVEADETYIGGKARNMHANRKRDKIKGTRNMDEVPVIGTMERGGEVRASVLPNVKRPAIEGHVRQHVESGATLYTDKFTGYLELGAEYSHETVDHATEYVRGQVHTNGIENFWSLLKRGLTGTYISVQPFHLFRYLDEQVYRFNSRKVTDLGRFVMVLQRVAGRRLTYAELTGKA